MLDVILAVILRLTFSNTPDEALVETRQKLLKRRNNCCIREQIRPLGHIQYKFKSNKTRFNNVPCRMGCIEKFKSQSESASYPDSEDLDDVIDSKDRGPEEFSKDGGLGSSGGLRHGHWGCIFGIHSEGSGNGCVLEHNLGCAISQHVDAKQQKSPTK